VNISADQGMYPPEDFNTLTLPRAKCFATCQASDLQDPRGKYTKCSL